MVGAGERDVVQVEPGETVGEAGDDAGMVDEAEVLADLRVAGVRVRAPVPLTGTLAAPRLELAGLTEGAIGGLLGAPAQAAGGGGLTDCATALRVARGGREGPVPAAQPQPPGNAQPALNNLLRGLVGR